MTNSPKRTVETFGNDCLGNITGYRVVERGWEYTGNPHRADGCTYVSRVVSQHVGSIYEPGSFEAARQAAEASCNA